jgi:hypothetical protein
VANDAQLAASWRFTGQTCVERFAVSEPAKRNSPMKIPDSVDQLPTNGTRGRVYGEPYHMADGGTVITVAKNRAGTSVPVGVFVIHGGKARWVPAVDANRIALIGVLTGMVAAVLASIAVLRRPPWPDLSATSAAWQRH